MEISILLADKQISAKASRVLYGEALLYLSCDEALRMPFPECPLRGFGMLMKPANIEGEKLYPQVFRRFRKIRLTLLVGAECDSESDSRDTDYYGHMYGYTSSEMSGNIKGFKQILGGFGC